MRLCLFELYFSARECVDEAAGRYVPNGYATGIGVVADDEV